MCGPRRRPTGGSLPQDGHPPAVRLPLPLPARRVRIGAVLVVTSVICYFSLLDAPPAQPPAPPGEGPLAGLSLLHVVSYAALAGSLAYATVELADRPLRRVAVVVGVAVLYGVLVEAAQAPLPDRYYSTADMVANTLGAAVALPWFLVERAVEYVPVPSGGG